MNIALVVNPSSGRRFNGQAIETLKTRLSEKHQIREFPASSDAELDAVGNHLSVGFDIVIICGGDGTVSRICHYLISTDVPLLVFPMGSGNDFANHLNMSNNIDAILDNIDRYKIRKINSNQIKYS
jgi:diacylglycerol kinase family enzyme